MNYVYFPAPVVLILRRLANVISTLSISNQYLLMNGTRAEDQEETECSKEKLSSWGTIQALREVGWPTWLNRDTWQWPQFMAGDHWQPVAETAGLKVPDLTMKCGCCVFHLICILTCNVHEFSLRCRQRRSCICRGLP